VRGLGLVRGHEFTCNICHQASRRILPDHGDDLAPLAFRQPALAPTTRPIAETSEPLGVEAGQALAHRLRMAPEGNCDRGRPLARPAQDHHLRPTNPVTRGMPAPSQLPDRPFLGFILCRTRT
jgi:hypothetical protein